MQVGTNVNNHRMDVISEKIKEFSNILSDLTMNYKSNLTFFGGKSMENMKLYVKAG